MSWPIFLAVSVAFLHLFRVDAVRGYVASPPNSIVGELRSPLPPDIARHVVSMLPPLVAYSYGGGRVRLWPSREGVLPPSGDNMHFLPGGERLLTTRNWGNSPIVWSIAQLHPIELEVPPDLHRSVWDSCPFPDGERIAGLTQHSAVIWSASTGALLHRMDVGQLSDDSAIWVLHPCDLLLVLGSSGELSVWNISSGQMLHSLPEPWDKDTVAVSPCGGKVLIAGMGRISLWDGRTGVLQLDLPEDGYTPRVRVSRGGARIFVSDDKQVRVRDGFTGEAIRTMSMLGGVSNFAIDPDGCRVFAFGVSNRVASDMVWDVESGKPLHSLDGRWPYWHISALLVSAAGDAVATCVQSEREVNRVYDEDRDEYDFDLKLETQVRVWHAASGRPLHTFEDQRDTDGDPDDHGCVVALSSVAELLTDGAALSSGSSPQCSV
mmetsp:Transcript_25829/g.73455  ORF Transcript_25829/g.73455 Transcript_25829/m.73455 type:complete len:435 (-) Transcript_25829:155-1459(-)